MSSRPHLLYVSPVLPALGGNGLAMRAGMVLQALAARHRVWLLVATRYPSPVAALPEPLAALCEDVVVLPPFLSAALARPRPFTGVRFDVVHAFRLAMLGEAEPYLGRGPWRRPRRHLDLDDIESITGERLAALHREAGNRAEAHRILLAAAHARTQETLALQRFDRVYVCSEADMARLRGRGSAVLCVLPNAVRLPDPPPLPPSEPPFTFLLTGTLNYYPNEDAAIYFCHEVLPYLRALAPGPFRVEIVGRGANPPVEQLAREPEVAVTCDVPEIAPHYYRAGAVVVPLRAGGGTRIKVLEAFSYKRPVVSTSIGIEGIDAHDGVEVLIGDSPQAFAAACARLMHDPATVATLTAQAFALLLRAYTPDALRRALDHCSAQ